VAKLTSQTPSKLTRLGYNHKKAKIAMQGVQSYLLMLESQLIIHSASRSRPT